MVGMPDEWDIANGVGLTALAVAAARAVETASANGLVRDRYAQAFVRAAKLPVSLEHAAPAGHWAGVTSYMGLRSRFFDDYFAAASVDQVVILAAGLDTRAYRLNWSGCHVYEVDQPRVLAFKQQVLDAAGAVATCHSHPVATDLREDWAGALLAAGFEPARPTAWLAEGLLFYLPPKAEETLFDTINELSAPGSHIAVEELPDRAILETADTLLGKVIAPAGVNMAELLNNEPRPDPVDRLRSLGWRVTAAKVAELYAHYRRPLPELLDGVLGYSQFLVTATLPARQGTVEESFPQATDAP